MRKGNGKSGICLYEKGTERGFLCIIQEVYLGITLKRG